MEIFGNDETFPACYLDGPHAYHPLQCDFEKDDANFKHFDAKWAVDRKLSWQPVVDKKLCSNLKMASIKIFNMCEVNSYARCDFR